MTITEQSKQLCALTLLAGRGLCTFSARQLATGSYILVATYSGNTLYLSSSKTLKLVVVGPKATTTVLACPSPASPTGTSSWGASTSRPRPCGSVRRPARLGASEVGVGVHYLVATYEGSPPYLGSVATAKLSVVA